VNEAGTLRLVELVLRATVPPPDPVRVTVQELEASGTRVPGLQARAAIPVVAGGVGGLAPATRESVVEVGEPFSMPVIVTV